MAHSNDEVEVDMITEQGMNDALAALEKADKSARYAKTLKAQLSRPPDKSDSPEVIHALRVAIAHGLVNPGAQCHKPCTHPLRTYRTRFDWHSRPLG